MLLGSPPRQEREGKGKGKEKREGEQGEGSRVRQREKWACSKVPVKASAKPMRSCKAEVALPNFLGQIKCARSFDPLLTSH